MLIKLNKISKTFGEGIKEVKALKNINLEIETGAFTAVSGPSGSGKSTLLNVIGLLDNADNGEYYFDGVKIDSNNEAHINHLRAFDLGFIFQDFNLLPVLTALENVEMSALSSIPNAAQRKTQAQYFLEQVGLKDKMDTFPHQLSGGQQQRVSVARSLMGESKLILADEPTANLDSENTFILIDLMKKLNQELGTTFLFSTHDDRLLDKVSNTINLLDGELV
ncbi:MAG: ABC transporter ATP-binding protein [Candidatus Thiodubiliella endoseptemdiera]|uniref:ABC transporter ATP-binding protein n=1 Tax=Candidatus Thiodubiliella endoseptemdiera TaxID=2738886 RepID=A0A853F2E2_9GAMM|nr:ABC transporter ATP-binding protein [Candidatus Thiodubiliella endoseptemdiera]